MEEEGGMVALEKDGGNDGAVSAFGGGVGGGYGAADGGVDGLDPGGGGWEELCCVSRRGMEMWRGRGRTYMQWQPREKLAEEGEEAESKSAILRVDNPH